MTNIFCPLTCIVFSFSLPHRTGDRVPLQCVDRHPNQQHIVATGGQDGMLCIWDVRQGNVPLSLMEAHSAESEGTENTPDVFSNFLTHILPSDVIFLPFNL